MGEKNSGAMRVKGNKFNAMRILAHLLQSTVNISLDFLTITLSDAPKMFQVSLTAKDIFSQLVEMLRENCYLL